jgi:hypothetical protein
MTAFAAAARHGQALTVILAATVALGGCAEPDIGTSPQTTSGWQEPARYSYVLESRCGEQQLIGKFQVSVVDGAVTDAKGLDEAATNALRGTQPDLVPTLDRLLEQVNEARRSGAEIADVDVDPGDGHPVRITIDPRKNTIDDESCFTISDYSAS